MILWIEKQIDFQATITDDSTAIAMFANSLTWSGNNVDTYYARGIKNNY